MKFDKVLNDIFRRLHALEHPPLRPVRQTLIFSFPGQITQTGIFSGGYPIFDNGEIFELWVSSNSISDGVFAVTFWRKPEGTPSPYPIDSIVLAPGDDVEKKKVAISVREYDRIYVSISNGANSQFPSDVSIAARVG